MKKLVLKIGVFLCMVTMAATLCADGQMFRLDYYYDADGVLAGKALNGRRVNYQYDLRGQLLAVVDEKGQDVERYTYDPAGNRLSKTVAGKTTTYAYDEANQLISETTEGVTKHYAYDAAGRMTRAGDNTYRYDGRGKLAEVIRNGRTIADFEYDIDGQLSKAIYEDRTEEFVWDGLALVWRSGVAYVNEPAVTYGNPVMAGDDVLFNDMLGSTHAVGTESVEMTAFGETESREVFFTGKPYVDELGYSFLLRNYSPEHGKWTSADPWGYPDGWNNLIYCRNSPLYILDLFGAYDIDWIGTWNQAEKDRVTMSFNSISNRINNLCYEINYQARHLDAIKNRNDVYYDKAVILRQRCLNLIQNLRVTYDNINSATYKLDINKISSETCIARYIYRSVWSDKLEITMPWFDDDIDYQTIMHELMHTWSDDGESGDNFLNSHMLENLYEVSFFQWICYQYEYHLIWKE